MQRKVHQSSIDLQVRNAELNKEIRTLEDKVAAEKRTTGNAMFTMNHAKEGRKQALVQ